MPPRASPASWRTMESSSTVSSTLIRYGTAYGSPIWPMTYATSCFNSADSSPNALLRASSASFSFIAFSVNITRNLSAIGCFASTNVSFSFSILCSLASDPTGSIAFPSIILFSIIYLFIYLFCYLFCCYFLFLFLFFIFFPNYRSKTNSHRNFVLSKLSEKKPNKTNKTKTKQNKTKQNKTKQNKTKQNNGNNSTITKCLAKLCHKKRKQRQ